MTPAEQAVLAAAWTVERLKERAEALEQAIERGDPQLSLAMDAVGKWYVRVRPSIAVSAEWPLDIEPAELRHLIASAVQGVIGSGWRIEVGWPGSDEGLCVGREAVVTARREYTSLTPVDVLYGSAQAEQNAEATSAEDSGSESEGDDRDG